MYRDNLIFQRNIQPHLLLHFNTFQNTDEQDNEQVVIII